jgi:methylmalonyl-CoA mutase C-terminal domain/subunit
MPSWNNWICLKRLEQEGGCDVQRSKVRIILAKIGLDDHARSLTVLSKAFRDAGFEIINLGPYQTPEMVVSAAVAEDANAIGLSFHTLTYLGWAVDVFNLLKEKEMDDVDVFVGGAIPEADDTELKDLGVKGIYRPGTPLGTIVGDVERIVVRART